MATISGTHSEKEDEKREKEKNQSERNAEERGRVRKTSKEAVMKMLEFMDSMKWETEGGGSEW